MFIGGKKINLGTLKLTYTTCRNIYIIYIVVDLLLKFPLVYENESSPSHGNDVILCITFYIIYF